MATTSRATSAAATDEPQRHVVWRVYCPSCLTPFDGVEHRGLADLVHQFKCSRCQRRFSARTGVRSTGGPVCTGTPTFIKAPEVVDDNAPVARP